MNKHYKIIYKVEKYETPHYKFYTTLNEQAARDLFSATCEESFKGSNVEILDVVQIENPDTDCCNPDSCSC
ncbi:hypothetical protein N9033_00255 [bacterium]|nr:hypothetical protein [bacterium]